jgi:putative NADH-flavin reductase
MRILLYGATGLLGQRILGEALDRGHEVTAASPDPSRIQELPGVTLRRADVLDPDSLAALADGHDALVSAVGPGHAGDPCFPVAAARALLEVARRTGVRLVAVEGTGSSDAPPGLQPAETLDFAATWAGDAQALGDALDLYRAAPETVDWSYVVPRPAVAPGEQSGPDQSRGNRSTDDRSARRVSAADVAAAVLDELEHPRHRRRAFTIPAERETVR